MYERVLGELPLRGFVGNSGEHPRLAQADAVVLERLQRGAVQLAQGLQPPDVGLVVGERRSDIGHAVTLLPQLPNRHDDVGDMDRDPLLVGHNGGRGAGGLVDGEDHGDLIVLRRGARLHKHVETEQPAAAVDRHCRLFVLLRPGAHEQRNEQANRLDRLRQTRNADVGGLAGPGVLGRDGEVTQRHVAQLGSGRCRRGGGLRHGDGLSRGSDLGHGRGLDAAGEAHPALLGRPTPPFLPSPGRPSLSGRPKPLQGR